MRAALLVMACVLAGCAGRREAMRGLGEDRRRSHPWTTEMRPLNREPARFEEDVERQAGLFVVPAGDLARSLDDAGEHLRGGFTTRPGREEILGLSRRVLMPEGDLAHIRRDTERFLAELPGRPESMREFVDRVVLRREVRPGQR